jgi:hypothetical protein
VGILFALVGPVWVGAWALWDSTRLWVPLDVPVSLAAGHIRTPEFEINVPGTYTVCVAVNWPSNNDVEAVMSMLGISSFDSTPSIVGISWRLSSAGRMLASADSDRTLGAMGGMCYQPNRDLGNFYAGKGRYVLDLDMERDGSRLNRLAPHLLVVENGNRREESNARGNRGALLLLLFPIGVVLLVRSANGWRIEKQNAWKKAWPLTQPGPQLQTMGERLSAAPSLVRSSASFPRRRPAPPIRPAFTRPAWTGLLMLLCYLVVDIPVWVIYFGDRPVPMGLPVHLMKTASSNQAGPGIQPLLVTLVLAGCDPHPQLIGGSRPCLYIDSQLVSWDAFDTILQQKLRLRPPDWPVYLEGDKAMEWRDVGEVIDKIRGLHAEVVLLGSRTP